MNKYVEQLKSISSDSKYRKWYLSIVLRARERAKTRVMAKKLFGYTEEHHIVPKSFGIGGGKDPENFSYLTAKEHLVCHLLLVRIFRDGLYGMKMNAALAYFSRPSKNHKGRAKLTGWEYEQSKKAAASASSKYASVAIEVDGVRYESLKEAAEKLGMSKGNVCMRLKNSNYPTYRYLNKTTVKKQYGQYRKQPTIDGVTYESVEQARKILGLKRCEIDCRFADINYPNYVLPGVEKTYNRVTQQERRRPLVVDGVEYQSISFAIRGTGLHKDTIKYRIKSKTFTEYYYVEDVVNEQR